MAQTEIDVSRLYDALNTQRGSRDMTWRELAAALGLSPSTFTRLAQGSKPDADSFLTMVEWLGVPAQAFASGPSSAGSAEPEPLVAVTSLLRASSRLSRDEADALNRIIEAAYAAIVKEKGEP